MLIGVISDTHGILPAAAAIEMAQCDHIIHAGDICDPGILQELMFYAPVTAVLGNNDYPEYGPDVSRFANVEIGGVRFFVTHYPHDAHVGAHGNRFLAPGDALPQISIHGHTHIPEIVSGREAFPARLMLCPGSCSRPRGGMPPSIAKIIIEDGAIGSAWVESLKDGSTLMSWPQ